MTAWTKDDLARIGRAEEIDIAVRRPTLARLIGSTVLKQAGRR
jgi:hypothetical protein